MKNADDPDEYGFFGKTPVMLAAYETNLAAVEILLKLGADPNIPSRAGCNAVVATLLRSTTADEVLIKLQQKTRIINSIFMAFFLETVFMFVFFLCLSCHTAYVFILL